ncbi:MAG: transposase [Methylococcales bacterium]|nr:transposase [Methylococcales bacterium]
MINFRGKANYTNLSRYNELSEKTYRRWFNKKLDFLKFNQVGNNEILSTSGQKIAALECSFVNKSGEKTYGLAKFWDSKQKFTHGVIAKGYHQIGKLRCDANLRLLYEGVQKEKGRHKCYDGKWIVGETRKLELAGKQGGVKVYTAIVNSVSLKCNIRIAYLVKTTSQGTRYALLFSTDTEIDAMTLYNYYKARFQIEFLFRDAKQFTGLCDCQARSEPALHSHFKARFTALNLIKWHDRLLSPKRKPISIGSWKTRFFNELSIERILLNSGVDLSLIKCSSQYEELCSFGVISH